MSKINPSLAGMKRHDSVPHVAVSPCYGEINFNVLKLIV